MHQALSVVILAAGRGTRMQSNLPKVLHCLSHKPLAAHVLDVALSLSPQEVFIVHGFGSDALKSELDPQYPSVNWVFQPQQLGTGHAVQQVLSKINGDNQVLVLYADVPLVQQQTLKTLIELGSDLALLTVNLNDPSGYGRIIRGPNQNLLKVVEHKDANQEELSVHEVNTGILSIAAKHLLKLLPGLTNDNAQGEYYLTDLIERSVQSGLVVNTTQPTNTWEVEGVNNPAQLAALERLYQSLAAEKLMQAGLYLKDPKRFDLRGHLKFGKDVNIDVNVVIEGEVFLGDGVTVGPFTYLKDVSVGAGSVIKSHTHVEDAVIQNGCRVGPYARIRPGTLLADETVVGNFVETKKSQVGKGSKINHLSYVGDAQIGEAVNIGAGTITCNYDGVQKHQTRIESGAFIGSNTALVAPVTIGEEATIGAGSTISKDVEPGTLSVARGRQVNVTGWRRPTKETQTD